MSKIPKTGAGYQFRPNTQYICADCVSYDPEDRRCLFLGESDVVLPFDSCNYFAKGEPGELLPVSPELAGDDDGDSAMGLVNIQEAGFARSNFGFSCKRCVAFIRGADQCNVVEGTISPDGCCNLWTPDPERSNWPTEAFDAVD